jgi:protein-disulfide isomerase
VLILTAAVAAVLGIVTFMSSDNDAAPATTAIDAATLASTSGGGQVGGAVNPVITLVEYGDYQCPHCKNTEGGWGFVYCASCLC